MKFHELQRSLHRHPTSIPRFVLPDGTYVPAHAHITEVGHVVRNFVDCGGTTGKEEKVLLQTHVENDKEHRLTSDRLAKILQLGSRVIPRIDLDVEVEYDCCVVAQYPIEEARPKGQYLDLVLGRGRTQCRPRERRKAENTNTCCGGVATCC